MGMAVAAVSHVASICAVRATASSRNCHEKYWYEGCSIHERRLVHELPELKSALSDILEQIAERLQRKHHLATYRSEGFQQVPPHVASVPIQNVPDARLLPRWRSRDCGQRIPPAHAFGLVALIVASVSMAIANGQRALAIPQLRLL
ncbi:hypothetical protein BOO86_21515 [Mycobacterium sp. CBMA 234]|nr:hypothetical protein [Mycolicibacterium sp. CBMA 234]